MITIGAKYDGEVIIDTKIRTESAIQKLMGLENKMKKTSNEAELLASRMKKLENAKIPTEDYKAVQKQIESTRSKLSAVNERMEKWIEMGKSTESNTFKSMQYDAEQLKNTMNYLQTEAQEMRNAGKAFIDPTATEAYQKMVAKQQQLNGQQAIYKRQWQDIVNKEIQVNQEAEKMPSKFEKIKSAVAKIKDSLKDIASRMKKVHSSTKKTDGGFKNLLRTMKQMMLSMAVFQVMFKGLEYVKSGLQNLAVYSKEYNKTMSDFTSATAQLKNGLAVAFQPILNMVIPALTSMINHLNEAVNAVGRFFAIMAGKSTYTKAIKQNKDYAASLDKAGSSAEDAKGSLAEFDDLNVLQKNNTSGGGSSDGMDGSGFAEEAVGEPSDWTKSFKEAIEAGDWYGVGALLAEKLNSAILAINFDGLGKTIALKINDALHVINGFLQTFDFRGVGTKIGELLNEIIITIQNVDWGAVAQAFSAGVRGIFDSISGFLQEVDWMALGATLYEAIITFFTNIDWSGLAAALFEFIGSALGGIGAFIGGVLTEAWEDIKEAWAQVMMWWNEAAYEDGTFTIEGLFQGILDKLANIGTWIVDHIFTPFIEGFKAAFGIHSPSTVMEEMGEYIIEGLKNGLIGMWEKVKDIVTNFKTNIRTAFASIKTTVASIFTSMKTSVIGIFKGIWTGIKSIINNIIGGVGKMANSVINGINGMIDALNGLCIDVPEWAQGVVGTSKIGFNIPALTTIKIPRLANGGITTGSTLANIGEAGREAVLPLENNTGWMDDLAQKLADKMPGTAQTINLVAELDGREVYRSVVRLDKQFYKTTGKSQFSY